MPNGTGEKRSGCGRYILIGCGSLFVLGIIGAIVIFFVAKGWYTGVIEDYTETEPLDLPVVQMPDDQVQALIDRVDSFKYAVQEGNPTEPLVLTNDEVNAIIQHHPDFQEISDKVYVTLEDDKLHGQVSIPLTGMPMAEGRYLNGSASFSAALASGRLMVFVESLDVAGKEVPAQLMRELGKKNLAEDVANDPDIGPVIEKLESIDIAEGQLTIKARTP